MYELIYILISHLTIERELDAKCSLIANVRINHGITCLTNYTIRITVVVLNGINERIIYIICNSYLNDRCPYEAIDNTGTGSPHAKCQPLPRLSQL